MTTSGTIGLAGRKSRDLKEVLFEYLFQNIITLRPEVT